MTSETKHPPPEELLAQIAALQEEVATLQQEKADLELLMKMTAEHSDQVADELFHTAEAAQRESEERFQVITNTVPVPIIVSRLDDDTIVYANTAAGELTGLSTESLTGHSVGDFYHDSEERKQLLATVAGQGHLNNHELQGKRAHDGQRFWAAVFIRPLTFNEEPCLLEAYHDLTAHKQAENALQEERNILRTLIDNIPDYIYVKDSQTRFMLGNAAVAQTMGVDTSEKLIGKTDLDFFPEELAAKYQNDDLALLNSGQPLLDMEEPVVFADGSQGWLSTTKVPLKNSQGDVVGLIGIGRNITARKQAEAQREQVQQEIIEAQERSIQELSTPVIPILDRIIVMPLIGSIDSMRARDITRSLLGGISQHQAKVVILDITGVPLVDSGVANHLNKTIQAARLKGAQTIVTGITEAVAETIVDLGIDWSEFTTLSDLQRGLVFALKSLGITLSK